MNNLRALEACPMKRAPRQIHWQMREIVAPIPDAYARLQYPRLGFTRLGRWFADTAMEIGYWLLKRYGEPAMLRERAARRIELPPAQDIFEELWRDLKPFLGREEPVVVVGPELFDMLSTHPIYVGRRGVVERRAVDIVACPWLEGYMVALPRSILRQDP